MDETIQKQMAKAASTGFITTLKLAGLSDEQIKAKHESYLKQREIRMQKYAGVQRAILGQQA